MSSPNSISGAAAPVGGWQSVAKIIDHTQLRPEATSAQIVKLCDEAKEYGFGAVMLNPCCVELAHSRLQGRGVKVGTVIGFPLGATLGSVKRFEAAEVLRLGAAEIDMVQNIGALKSGNRELVSSEIRALAELAHERGALLKVILEMGLLTEEEKVIACELSERAGADFVKTSTGFLGGVATVLDVALMRRTVKIGVKASGGIRTAADAMAMIEAGAGRLGTSAGVNIIRELRNESAAGSTAAY
ncbi:MAG TPA: deoxyribose-phosphate aldolase [Candidatus Acidoferrales bacterium]|jgi:deoxyribose-phosphate aldolase|nr:deoxyribose-phosphate aldolase [Candidatus Acidoferrales bacterium]